MMRKILYIFGFLFCISCNEFSPKSENSTAPTEDSKVQELYFDTDGSTDAVKGTELSFTTNYFRFEAIDSEISEKLQANYEAQLLATKHPEFAEAINEQLANSSKFKEAIADSIQTISIENIEFLGDLQTRNDDTSIQKMSFTKRINSTYTEKDSVLVVIKRSVIEIDDTKKVNTSFSFENLD
ncbi:hypothetical protein KORDIASMS9_00161 [Kordia sp. SMS9]|uniref:hypothetical protein n=1 Tax=Kordia sp. SMS9 TaxID=2282170 RepID=UPI000E0D3023|nr:hypothetical protein [Kordia sp. SMS9]AXG67979.1 hypothetical protein KORDIASMS9_00161 [Kordia sp. SMS9]